MESPISWTNRTSQYTAMRDFLGVMTVRLLHHVSDNDTRRKGGFVTDYSSLIVPVYSIVIHAYSSTREKGQGLTHARFGDKGCYEDGADADEQGERDEDLESDEPRVCEWILLILD
jgi:hypothetical protein